MADTMIEVQEDIFTGNVAGIYGSSGVFSGNQKEIFEEEGLLLGNLSGIYSGGIASAGKAIEVSEIEDLLFGSITLPSDGWHQVQDKIMGEVFQGATYPQAGDTMRLIDYIDDPKPIADFEALPVDGIAPFAVHFVDKSTNSPLAWKWIFGDGHTSTAQNPTHVYSAPGKYSVLLRVFSYTQNDSIEKVDYIKAGVLDFHADHVSGPVKLKCRFTVEIVIP